MRRSHLISVALLASCLAPRMTLAEEAWESAVHRGVDFLKTQIPKMNSGEAGISALAMIKSHVPLNDPGLVACIARFGQNFNGTTYTPETKGGSEIYECSVAIMAMVNIDPVGYKPYIDAACQYLLSKQMPNGAWDYSDRTAGDVSISQYALLGLWEGENVGITVPAKVWDMAAKWYISTQNSTGSWIYHPDDTRWPPTVAMTGAGVGSLMLCQHQLVRHRKGQEQLNPLMTPLVIDGMAAELRYKVETSTDSVNKAMKAGIRWMGENFQTSNAEIVGQSIFYCLYGMERVIALAKDLKLQVPSDWYKRGIQYVLGSQKASGAWDGVQHKEVPNTCWAILFSTKATEISVNRITIRRLGSARLKGGRNLPTNLDDVEVVQGELVVKPMGGAVEGMLAALEDPKGESAMSALEGLKMKYQTEGPKALRPHKERFRKLVNDRDEGLRKVAIWALGRTGDLDAAPILIKALLDPDEDVMNEARVSLQVLSRKLEGFGPEPKSSPEERQAAALKWQEWFESVKPPDLDSPDELPVGNPKTPAK